MIVQWLVVHTAGAFNPKTRKVVYQPISAIRDYHMKHNGWRDIGYHGYIEEDGTYMTGRPEDHIGAGASGFNHHALHICVAGHGDYAPFNTAQEATLIMRLTRWCREHRLPAERVIGHRETDEHGGPPVYKTCPGDLIDMNLIRAKVRERLELTA